MSSYLNLADIASKLHSLEDIEKSLQKLIAEIQAAKKKGEAWLQTRNASTYKEIKEFLVGSTGEILQTCLTLGSQGLKKSSETTTLQTVKDGISTTVSNYEGQRLKQSSETTILQTVKDGISTTVSNYEEFLCIQTGQSYAPCVENCTHIIGQHEQVVTEDNVVDVQKHLADCTKNPGHSKFIPVDSFSVDHLPKSRRNSYLHAYIKSLADLTVKVSVTLTSSKRPKFWPGTEVPYFLYAVRGSRHLRTGSGRVSNVSHHTDTTCPCRKCFSSNDWNSEWWEVEVVTAANLVFNNVEARYTTVRLFYDKEDSPEVTLCFDARVAVDINNDTSVLKFVTCNEKLGKKIQDILKQHESVRSELYQNYRDIFSLKDKIMWIVSHPHGGSKQISIGTWKYEYSMNYLYRMGKDYHKSLYTTCTCPGSTGAPIDGISFRLNVHSGCLKSGLGYSCLM